MAFSPSGDKLAVCGIDVEHKIGIFDVKRGKKLVIEKGDTAIILSVTWTSEDSCSTVGPKHFKVWSYAGGKIKGKKGIFGRKNENKLTCNLAMGSEVLAGTLKGHL